MSSTTSFISIHRKIQSFSLGNVSKFIAIAGLTLFLFYAYFLYHPNDNPSDFFSPFQIKCSSSTSNSTATNSPTNIGHLGFIVVSSVKTWSLRKPHTLSWWRPNVTRGYLFLDQEPTQEFLPWPATYPPYKINDDITKLRIYPKIVQPIQVRIFRSILDMYRVGDKDLRWFLMGDDDTIFFVDNLVEVLGKYDHTKYFYIGKNSECVKSNADFSFDMAFGGGGYALSYAFVELLSTKIDACIERYPHLLVSDHMAMSCFADLGVSLTLEKGFHQIDLHNDVSGLLSSHPQSPLLTLHHLDFVAPIFPSMERHQAVIHLMKSAQFDQSRLLQHTICYQRQTNWSFSVSWGYSAHIYENIIPRSILSKPLETFAPWQRNVRPPFFMFNTRWITNDPCEAPHWFFMESVDYGSDDRKHVLTTYVRASPRNLPPCSMAGNHSADPISKIRVISPARTRKTGGVTECCDVESKTEMNVTEIKIRSCMRDEVVA